MKIMTYNVCSGHNLAGKRAIAATAEFIKSTGAPIVGLNEIDYRNRRSHMLDQADYLRDHAGYTYCAFSPSIDFQGGYYGNALLSQFPMISREFYKIPYMHVPGNRTGEPRSILKCVLDVCGKPLTVLVSHYGLSEGERIPAIELTLKLASEAKTPVIFMGDLNAEPDAPEMQPLFSELNDTAAAFDWHRLMSFDSAAPNIKIDYIFTKGNIITNSVAIPAVQFSDHRPYIADLTL